ncbi:hypothetical protein [Methylomonas sp. MgM2]
MGELSPLRGEAVSKAYEAYCQKVGNAAADDGLTEEDVTTLVHASR